MTQNRNSSKDGRRLYKSRKDKMIDGVCSGVADYFSVDPTLVRIIWVVAALPGGFGIFAYILGMIFIPPNPEHEKLDPEQKKKWNPGIIWGALLIFLGIAFFLNRWGFRMWDWPMSFHFGYWWGIPWKIIWPLALIGGGIAYIIFMTGKKREAQQNKPDNKNKNKSLHKKLFRSRDQKVLGGVCGGLAEYLSIDPTILRIIVVAVALTHLSFWIILYLVSLFIIPMEDAGQKAAT